MSEQDPEFEAVKNKVERALRDRGKSETRGVASNIVRERRYAEFKGLKLEESRYIEEGALAGWSTKAIYQGDVTYVDSPGKKEVKRGEWEAILDEMLAS